MKATQIAILPESNYCHPRLFALGENGQIYFLRIDKVKAEWEEIPALPKPKR